MRYRGREGIAPARAKLSIVSADQEEFFDSRPEAEARCRELERDSDSSWIAYPADGRWRIAETNLPPQEAPDGTATASKPQPDADDPRSSLGRGLPGTGYQ